MRVVSLSVPTSFLWRRVSVFWDSNLQPRDSSFPTRVAFSCRPEHRRVLCFCKVVAPSNTHSPFVQLAAMNDDNHNNQSIDNINDFHVPAVIAFPVDKCVRCRQQNQTPSSQQLRGDLCCACCLLVLLEFCVGGETTDPFSSSSR